MGLNFDGIELQGPFSRLDQLEDQPGVVAILCFKDNRFELLDVRTAKLVQTEVADILAEPSWSEVCGGKLRVAVFYTANEEELLSVKQQVMWAKLF